MATPVIGIRATPRGAHLLDGYQCFISFSLDQNICFREKSIKPPGWDGGEKIDETTMHNETIKTFAARSLVMLTDTTTTVAYDPVFYHDIFQLINFEQTITITFSNGDQIAFFGYLQKFEPNEMKEGEQPDAQITVVAINRDPLLPYENPGFLSPELPALATITVANNVPIVDG